MVFADRDFYYGDPYFPPAEPMEGLLSKDYAKARLETINWEANDPNLAKAIKKVRPSSITTDVAEALIARDRADLLEGARAAGERP